MKTKTAIRLSSLILMGLCAMATSAWGQGLQPDIQYFRYNDKRGQNVYETSKEDTIKFEGVKIRIGGDFAMQFQSLTQSNGLDSLVKLGKNFNLPTANLNIDGQLYDGVRVHLGLYLSSLHHEETWVKGGYLQIDKLDFIKPGFMEGLMKVATLRIGLDEFNYGDAHFRRSDNARALYNPFVGNYIMDAFSTEAFGEVNIQSNGFIGVFGITNGKLNQNVVLSPTSDNKISFFGKVGYDKQISDDLRVRLTGSWYTNQGKTTGTYLYGGDRTGARYYNVMRTLAENEARTGTPFEGRINPNFKQLTAIQVNPFIKFQGLELFGIYEIAFNKKDSGGGKMTQVAAEAIYRFGGQEQLFVGGRYNVVNGKYSDASIDKINVNRINVGGGWFLTKNIVTKIEYVKQNYGDKGLTKTKYIGGEFNGLMIEAVIGF